MRRPTQFELIVHFGLTLLSNFRKKKWNIESNIVGFLQYLNITRFLLVVPIFLFSSILIQNCWELSGHAFAYRLIWMTAKKLLPLSLWISYLLLNNLKSSKFISKNEANPSNQCWTVGAIFTFGRSQMFGPEKLRPLAVGRSRSRRVKKVKYVS